MPKMTADRRRVRRDQIAAAAMRTFRREGLHAPTTQILAESGLSAGAFYGHYLSKEELIIDVAERIIDSRFRRMSVLTTARPLSPPDVLVRALEEGPEGQVGDPVLLVELW